MPARGLSSPVGPLTVVADGDGSALTALRWQPGPGDPSPLLDEATRQLTEYFRGLRTTFDLPTRVDCGQTQRLVCAAMAAIPFGETRTYGDIANTLNLPAQTVGQACGANPIPIIIPCHRVLSRSGLGGFSGGAGIETKVWLLKHEGAAGLLI